MSDLQKMYDDDLAELKELWEENNWLPALGNIIYYCQTVQIPLPEWAAVEVYNLIREKHFAQGGGSEGAYGGSKGRFNMDYAHWMRWKAVKSVLVKHRLSDLPVGKRGRRKKNDPPGRMALLREAAESLASDHRARCNVDTRQIEASYSTVQASRAAGERRFHFARLWKL